MSRMRNSGVRTLLLLLLVMSLAACASKRLTFEKPGVPAADLERDENACLRASLATQDGKILAPYCLDRDTFIRCMEGRGYTVSSK